MKRKIIEASCWLLLGLGLYFINRVILRIRTMPTIEKRISQVKTPNKNSNELIPKQKEQESSDKISKTISMKLITGNMPLSAAYQAIAPSNNDNNAVYDTKILHRITSYSFSLTCSGPILATCHWYIYCSKNKKDWNIVAEGDCQSYISHSGDSTVVGGAVSIVARYVKWRAKAEGAMMPGVYKLTISDPEVKGVKSIPEVR